MTLNSEGLLPCPFCGGAAEIEHSIHEDNHRAPRDFHHVRVICGDCEVAQVWLEFGEMMDRHREQPEAQVEAERKAIASWNRRALPPVDGLEVVALDLTKRIEREFYSDQPGGAVQTRAKVQVIIAEALSQASSVIAGLRSERITAERDALDAYGKLQTAEARISSLEDEIKRLREALGSACEHIEQLSELLKIIKDHWIDYDHVFSISVHAADEFLAARQALGESNG